MKKVIVMQRDEKREVYDWALAAGKQLEECTAYLRMLLPGTNIAVMHATWLTQLFEEHLEKAPMDFITREASCHGVIAMQAHLRICCERKAWLAQVCKHEDTAAQPWPRATRRTP